MPKDDSPQKGIYLAMPVLVTGDTCTGANWFADAVLSLLCPIVGFNGAVLVYTDCSYWSALWHWLFSDQSKWNA